MNELIQTVRTALPYLVIALLPGGSIIALFLWFFGHGPGRKLALATWTRLSRQASIRPGIPAAPIELRKT